jgi:flagellar basal-body rod modification protein FlgD
VPSVESEASASQQSRFHQSNARSRTDNSERSQNSPFSEMLDSAAPAPEPPPAPRNARADKSDVTRPADKSRKADAPADRDNSNNAREASSVSDAKDANGVSAAKDNSSNSIGAESDTIAGNFQSFLTLLTTQLKNQNPLDPLDTNQFTAQLVQFAQVEQQLKSNDQLTTLVSLQKTAQATQALNLVGQTVAVDGDTAPLKGGSATWRLSAAKPATAIINIMSSTGQTVYTATRSLTAGDQEFSWDGKDASNRQWPDGNYKISITAKDASGQAVAVRTEIQAVIDSADLAQTPPALSIAGRDYTLDKLKRVVRN